jgi:phosphatidylserine synthase
VLVPALLMVSTIRFRSVKAMDVGWTRSYLRLLVPVLALVAIVAHPRYMLVVLSYTYTLTALVLWIYRKARRRPLVPPLPESAADHPLGQSPDHHVS